jgi:hypothetical protein
MYRIIAEPGTESIDSVEFAFVGGLPLWVAVFTAIGLSVLAWWLYRREALEVRPAMRRTLTTLRAITYVLLLLALLKPVLKLDTRKRIRSVLPVLVDVSGSMGIADNDAKGDYLKAVAAQTGVGEDAVGKTSRHALVDSMLTNDPKQVLKSCSERYVLSAFTFDQDCQPWLRGENSPMPAPDSHATAVGGAVTDALRHVRGRPITDMVVITDGVNTLGEPIETVAAQLKSSGIRLFAVGAGLAERTDLRVVKIEAPELAFKGDDVPVEIVFEGSGLPPCSQDVTVTFAESPVTRKPVECQNGRFTTTVMITPNRKGEFEIKAAIDPHENEHFTANNEARKRIQVIDREIRVLFAVGIPSWEFRYLKGMLDRDKRFKTKVFMRHGDRTRSSRDTQYLSAFPFQKLNTFDCIIVNNLERDFFTRDQLKQLEKFVSEEGGSMIMVSAPMGTPGSYANTPVAAMLPVTFKSVPASPRDDYSRRHVRPFNLRLTDEGRGHPVSRLQPTPDENEAYWRDLPDHYWF